MFRVWNRLFCLCGGVHKSWTCFFCCCCLSLAVSIKNKVSIMAAMIDRYPKIGDFSHSLSHRSGPLVVFYVIFILCPVCSMLRSLPYTSTFIVSYTHGLSQMKRDHREIWRESLTLTDNFFNNSNMAATKTPKLKLLNHRAVTLIQFSSIYVALIHNSSHLKALYIIR